MAASEATNERDRRGVPRPPRRQLLTIDAATERSDTRSSLYRYLRTDPRPPQTTISGKYPLIEHEYDALVV